MRRLIGIVVLALALPNPLAAQGSPDSARIARLTALGHVYGVVKYFHPALIDRGIPWDSAVAAAAERIARVGTRNGYRDAEASALHVLRDPATRILDSARVQITLASASSPTKEWVRVASDSILVLTLGNLADYVAIDELMEASVADIKRARALVFDVRGNPDELGTADFTLRSDLLVASSVTAPAIRTRMYNGFAPEMGGTSGGYYSGTLDRAGTVFTPSASRRARRIIFIATSESDVPEVAFALRASGQSAIVLEGDVPALRAAALPMTVSLGEGMSVAIRTGERVGDSAPDTIVSRQPGRDVARDVAVALARRPIAPVRSRGASATSANKRDASAYPTMRYPSLGYRAVAAYKLWSTINYFFPYKHLIDEPWERALPKSVASMIAARDSLEYGMAVATMITGIQDSHGGASGNVALAAHLGRYQTAVQLQYIEGQPVVVHIGDDSATKASGLRIGDVIVRVDGEDATARRAFLERYIAHSTRQSLDATVASRLLRGRDTSHAVLLVRGHDEAVREVRVPRGGGLARLNQYPRSGPVMKFLPGNVGYADLSRLTVPMVDSMFDMFKDTRAIIFDGRGYPQGTGWSIAPRLTDKPVAAARFLRPLLVSADTTTFSSFGFVQYTPSTTKWRYRGRTVILVDERAVSQAEHTVLFLQAANKTITVGSPTMGANGDVTNIALPGGMHAYFSGHDVRHADGRQLQRVGIQPDHVVRPTIAGIRAERDEVLERALEVLSGRK